MIEGLRAFRARLKGWDSSIAVALIIWIVLRSYLVEAFRMAHDTVYRNGWRLDEPYALHLADGAMRDPDFRLAQIRTWQLPYYIGRAGARYQPTTHDWGPIVVPPGHYFVMGDNRDESYDSRFWGFLPRSHIVGQPLIIYLSIPADPLRIRWNRMLRRPH